MQAKLGAEFYLNILCTRNDARLKAHKDPKANCCARRKKASHRKQKMSMLSEAKISHMKASKCSHCALAAWLHITSQVKSFGDPRYTRNLVTNNCSFMCRVSRALQWRGCVSVGPDAIHCDGRLLFSALKRRLSLFIHVPAWCGG